MAPKSETGWRDYRRFSDATNTDRYPVPHFQDYMVNLHHLIKNRPGQGISSHLSAPQQRVQGSLHHPVRLVRIPEDAFRSQECNPNFLNAHRLRGTRPGFCFHLIGRYPGGQQIAPRACGSFAPALPTPERPRTGNQSGEVPIQADGDRLIGPQSQPAWRSSPTGQTIRQFPKPSTVKGLQEILRMVHFYHRFVPAAAHIMRPFISLLTGKAKKVAWDAESTEALEQAKEALAKAALLVHPRVDVRTALTVDSSDTVVGRVLEQLIEGQWRPLAFFSRHLRPTESKYRAFNRELLALYPPVRHFRYFLEGREFTMYMEHTFALAKVSDQWSARQQRHLSIISEFTLAIHHIAGKNNVIADILSHPCLHSVGLQSSGIDYAVLAEAQQSDTEITAYRTAI
ncbi:uncharacterized protein LOC132394219 [Hypanus sabinus]|uniref:uncharacterized protein LOC132394219 n=1 Tax=Hypanus sabinus TaxID=79690 RepID=UPI0028C4B9B9|nr:uncharacterized protein LOC132394219 [Hypanus sabinus]XP_059826083.1 uncharacterized protein LOC132394219 [Hypanus sabinus]